MKTILVLGAGRSSSALIQYLLDYARSSGGKVLVGDISREAAAQRIGTHPSGEAFTFDINDAKGSIALISRADVVASLLPAHHHHKVAELCLDLGRNLVTASYVSEEMRQLDRAARDKSLLFL